MDFQGFLGFVLKSFPERFVESCEKRGPSISPPLPMKTEVGTLRFKKKVKNFVNNDLKINAFVEPYF